MSRWPPASSTVINGSFVHQVARGKVYGHPLVHLLPVEEGAADVVAAPFAGTTLVDEFPAVVDSAPLEPEVPFHLPEKTDVWVSGVASNASTDVSVNFSIMLVKHGIP